jgi:hypothetical protein
MISDLLLDMYGNYVIQKALILANIEDKEFMLSVNYIFILGDCSVDG